MPSTIVAAVVAAYSGACPSPTFVAHDGALPRPLSSGGRQIGENREVGGAPFPNDVSAGQRLGEALWQELLDDPVFSSATLEAREREWIPAAAPDGQRAMTSPGKKDAAPPCPACHSRSVARIVYGLPSKSAMRAKERGEIVLGGCVVGDDPPRWRCLACGHDFGRLGPRTEPK
jgi:hypothetical protein